MRHPSRGARRRAPRLLVAALLAPALSLGLGSGAALAGLPEPVEPVAAVTAASRDLIDYATTTSSTGGGAIPSVSLYDVTHVPAPGPAVTTVGAVLDSLLNPGASANVCPAGGMDTATCDQAFLVLRAVSPCLAPFVSGTRAEGCGPLIDSTSSLLSRVAAEGVACANGANAVCGAATTAAVNAATALARCVAGDTVMLDATRDTILTGDGGNTDLYALCGNVVSAATAAAGSAVLAATACADGSDATCAAIVGTTLDVTGAALRCLGLSGLTPDGGPSLLAADLAGACESAVLTARDSVEALATLARNCIDGTDTSCRDAIDRAGAIAADVSREANNALTEAGRCLNGSGDASAVAACQQVQDAINGALAAPEEACGELALAADENGDAITDDLDSSLDPAPPVPPMDPADDPGYVLDWGGMVAVITECAPDGVVVGGATVTSEAIGLNGARIIQAAKEDDGGGGGVDFSSWGLKTAPHRVYEWAKPVAGSVEEETFGGILYAYDTKEPNKNGRLMAMIQKADIAIKVQRDFKIFWGESQLWHKNNRAKTHVWDVAPEGAWDKEESAGATVNVQVEASNQAQTGTFGVGWSKEYGIEYTTFAGRKLRRDFGDGYGLRTYGTEGGYSTVAHCHRAKNRAWAQGMMILLAKGAQPKFGATMYHKIKSRKGDSAC